MTQDNKQPSVFVKKTPRFSRQKIIVSVLGLIILVLVAVPTLLVVTNKITVIRAGSEAKGPAGFVVRCDSELIGRYRTALTQSTYEASVEQMQAVGAEVDALDGARDDPNCMYIRYMVAVQDNNHEDAKQAVVQLEALASAGNYPTAELGTVRDTEQLRQELMALENATPDGPNFEEIQTSEGAG